MLSGKLNNRNGKGIWVAASKSARKREEDRDAVMFLELYPQITMTPL